MVLHIFPHYQALSIAVFNFSNKNKPQTRLKKLRKICLNTSKTNPSIKCKSILMVKKYFHGKITNVIMGLPKDKALTFKGISVKIMFNSVQKLSMAVKKWIFL